MTSQSLGKLEKPQSETAGAVRNGEFLLGLKELVLPLLLFGFIANLTVLISPLYMMQVLDRVLPSGNLTTLALLAMLAAIALVSGAVIEYFRDQALAESARWIETTGADVILSGPPETRSENLGNLTVLRDFLGGASAVTALDAPWLPLFSLALYMIHPAYLIMLIVVVSGFALIASVRGFMADPALQQAASSRHASLKIMGILEGEGSKARLMSLGQNLSQRYLQLLSQMQKYARQGGTRSNRLDALGRLMRNAAQITALSLGAILVVKNELTAGGMIGASIIIARTIGVFESSIRHWSNLIQAKGAFAALQTSLHPAPQAETEINEFQGGLRAANLTFPRGGGAAPRIEAVDIDLKPGECLAILGESGSGKTTLLNALAGIDPAPIGTCFLDDTDVRTLAPATLAQLIGYLPQRATIIPGTIAENICRFAIEPNDEKILAASRLAGIHALISALPQSYETDMGAMPYALSAGQIQRLALARALYEMPKYLFLDEPNALLDHQAERQLGHAIQRLKKMGTTVVLVAHRVSIVSLADIVVVMDAGRIIERGPRSRVLGRMADRNRRLKLAIADGALSDLTDWIASQFVRGDDGEFNARAELVATELYHFATTQMEKTSNQILRFEFAFSSDHEATISLTSSDDQKYEKTVSKIRGIISSKTGQNQELGPEEQALATVMKVCTKFDHKLSEGENHFRAHINDAPSLRVVQ